MKITMNNSTLNKIYTGVATVYYAKIENETGILDKKTESISQLKHQLSSIMDIHQMFFKIKEETPVNSPYISSYSKDSKDSLNIDFSLPGLLMIKECLRTRLDVLNIYAGQIETDRAMLAEIQSSMNETRETLNTVEDYLKPSLN